MNPRLRACMAIGAALIASSVADHGWAQARGRRATPVRVKHAVKHLLTRARPTGSPRLALAAVADARTGEALVDEADLPPPRPGRCPTGMASIEGATASTDGRRRSWRSRGRHGARWPPRGGRERARPRRSPARRISAGVHQRRAGESACQNAGKRLCAGRVAPRVQGAARPLGERTATAASGGAATTRPRADVRRSTTGDAPSTVRGHVAT